MVRASELKAQPANDAATVTKLAADAAKVADLPANASVDARERRGGWMQVRTAAGQEGWIKILALRYGGAAKGGDTGITQAVNVARTGSSGTQVTTGVRGLDNEKIATAQPNAAELKKLEGFSVPAADSARFAQRGKLQAQTVSYPK